MKTKFTMETEHFHWNFDDTGACMVCCLLLGMLSMYQNMWRISGSSFRWSQGFVMKFLEDSYESYCLEMNKKKSKISAILRVLMLDLPPCGPLSANRRNKITKRLQWESWWFQMYVRNDTECEKILRFISLSAATLEKQRNLVPLPEAMVSRLHPRFP